MNHLKLPVMLLLSFGFLCLAGSSPISSLFGKSDDKVEAENKITASPAPTAKSGADVTNTPGSSSSCGGLKGFLHICDKTEPTELPKSVKTRSLPEESNSDSDSEESKSEEDSDEDNKPSTSSDVSEPTEGGIVKRQAGDLNVSETSETPSLESTSAAPAIPAFEDLPLGLKKRQLEESESSSDSESTEEESNRQRRECRDRPGDEWKDCKK